ncbi:hypothetical protein ACL02R_28370 [Streptomyces sp. MS19]|uniref:hypothetical protein n=1 Tax=Streptomyces sp. MS19 TaxID=3385972 RepID=UPI0039A1F1BD
MVSGLLFVALAFFVVAQAALLRGGGQSAADAAALAAAQEARDRLFDGVLDSAAGEGAPDLGDILGGDGIAAPGACDAAGRLAERNGAVVAECAPVGGRPGYRVVVTSEEDIDSVIPGVGGPTTVRTEATAVIEGLCDLVETAPEEPEDPDDGEGPDDPGDGEGGEGDEEEDDPAPVELDCEDERWTIDPDDEDQLPEARDLFRVYLED